MKLSDKYALRTIAGEHILLPLDAESVNINRMINLNDEGAYILRAIEKGKNADEIALGLRIEFGADAEESVCDTEVFTDKLIKMGILTD